MKPIRWRRHRLGLRGPLTVLLASAGAAWGCYGQQTEPVRGIVLVTLDTLNLRYVGPYNADVDYTPHLDQLAAAGVVFENAYTRTPTTLPSHTTMLTGLTPMTTGVLLNGDTVPGDLSTLAELLGAQGYRTAAFVSLGVLERRFQLNQGFEHFDDEFQERYRRWYRTADEVVTPSIEWVSSFKDGPFFLWVHLSDPHEPYLPKGSPSDSTLSLAGEAIAELSLTSKTRYQITVSLAPGRNVLEWKAKAPFRGIGTRTALELRLEPKALEDLVGADAEVPPVVQLRPSWSLELFNPHPESVPVTLRFQGKITSPPVDWVRQNYRREIEYLDRYLGRLRRHLRDLDLESSTLWIVASDHGEGLFHHGTRGHDQATNEDQLRVLWIMTGPGIPAGRRVSDAPVHLEDLTPTILDLAGLAPLERSDGVSRRKCWSPGGCSDRVATWWAYAAGAKTRRLLAVAGYDWPFKILWRKDRAALYELSRDPWEESSLPISPSAAGQLPRRARQLQSNLESRRTALQKLLHEPTPVELDDEQREMLRSLGYLN